MILGLGYERKNRDLTVSNVMTFGIVRQIINMVYKGFSALNFT